MKTPKDKYRVDATVQGTPNTSFGDTEHHICRFKIIESLEHKKLKYRAWEKPKYFGTRSQFPTYTLEPKERDTKFTVEVENEKFLGIFGEVLIKLFLRRWEVKQMQKSLENLKSLLGQ